MSNILFRIDRAGERVLGRRYVAIRYHPGLRALSAWPAARRFRGATGTGRAVLLEIDGTMGMGAVMAHAVRLLALAEQEGWNPRLAFTNSLYARDPGADWLPDFFIQPLAPPPDPTMPRLKVRSHWNYRLVKNRPGPTLDEGRSLFGRRLGFAPAVDDELAVALGHLGSLDRAIGVHYRGTDKMFEARSSAFEAMRRAIEAARERTGFDTLFVATDEPRFEDYLASALPDMRRLGYEQEGVTREAGKPIHFTEGDGYAKGMEAILLIRILAACGLLVRTPSFMSSWSQLLNPKLTTFIVNPGALYSAEFPDRELIAESYAVVEAHPNGRGRGREVADALTPCVRA